MSLILRRKWLNYLRKMLSIIFRGNILLSVLFILLPVDDVIIAQNVVSKQPQSDEVVKYITASDFKANVFDYSVGEYKFLGKKPVLIDFYATWCGPCKALSPIVDAIAHNYSSLIDVYKVDVDNEPELAQVFGVRSIPALLFVPKDGIPRMLGGYMYYERLALNVAVLLLGQQLPQEIVQLYQIQQQQLQQQQQTKETTE